MPVVSGIGGGACEAAGTSSGGGAPDLGGLRVLTTCEFVPWTSCGGSDVVAWQVARRLVGWNAEVTLVTGRPQGEARTVEVVEGVRVIGVPTVELSRRLGVELTVPRGLFRELRGACAERRPHVVHAHSLHFPSTVAAAVLARRASLPLVVTAHIGNLDHLPLLVRAPTALYERSVARALLAQAREVVAVSGPVAEHVRRRGGRHLSVTVANNGVDWDEFSSNGDLRAANPVPHVVYVGRLIANKGVELLVEALAELQRGGERFTGAFVGDGPLRRRLEHRAAELGLSERVAFTGARRDVAHHVGTADIVVRPSLTEGMPLALLEAMAAGACVIATDIAGNSELVEGGVSGLLVPPGSRPALAEALRRALRSPELRRRLGRAGQAVAAQYTWDESARTTAEVLVRAARPDRG